MSVGSRSGKWINDYTTVTQIPNPYAEYQRKQQEFINTTNQSPRPIPLVPSPVSVKFPMINGKPTSLPVSIIPTNYVDKNSEYYDEDFDPETDDDINYKIDIHIDLDKNKLPKDFSDLREYTRNQGYLELIDKLTRRNESIDNEKNEIRYWYEYNKLITIESSLENYYKQINILKDMRNINISDNLRNDYTNIKGYHDKVTKIREAYINRINKIKQEADKRIYDALYMLDTELNENNSQIKGMVDYLNNTTTTYKFPSADFRKV